MSSKPNYLGYSERKTCFFFCCALTAAAVIYFLAGCEWGVRKRAIGLIKLGKVSELYAPETYFPELQLLLRHDAAGFSVMSTRCTYDLSPLIRTDTPSGKVWTSKYTTSKYDHPGRVLEGPAKADLPYYELVLESGVYGGPKDTLYAHIGIEKGPQWRLQVKVVGK